MNERVFKSLLIDWYILKPNPNYHTIECIREMCEKDYWYDIEKKVDRYFKEKALIEIYNELLNNKIVNESESEFLKEYKEAAYGFINYLIEVGYYEYFNIFEMRKRSAEQWANLLLNSPDKKYEYRSFDDIGCAPRHIWDKSSKLFNEFLGVYLNEICVWE